MSALSSVNLNRAAVVMEQSQVEENQLDQSWHGHTLTDRWHSHATAYYIHSNQICKVRLARPRLTKRWHSHTLKRRSRHGHTSNAPTIQYERPAGTLEHPRGLFLPPPLQLISASIGPSRLARPRRSSQEPSRQCSKEQALFRSARIGTATSIGIDLINCIRGIAKTTNVK